MTVAVRLAPAASGDPLEAIEAVADQMELDAERIDADELHLAVPGAWRDAGVWFTWRSELATLQMGAPLDLKAPPGKVADAARLVAMVNERLWIGHFDLWSEDHAIVFRNAVVLPESGALERGQAQQLIRGVCEALDRFFPAFNFLIWGGKSPEEALEASLFETVGTA